MGARTLSTNPLRGREERFHDQPKGPRSQAEEHRDPIPTRKSYGWRGRGRASLALRWESLVRVLESLALADLLASGAASALAYQLGKALIV